jgi:2-iminobutanoate/2-iminopropanoate deaminase
VKEVKRKVKVIFTEKAPRPGGHYSQAIVHDDTVYVCGQLPIEPESGEKIIGPIEEQAEQALKNIAEILKAAGSDMNHVLKITVYLADISLWERFNAVYARFFGEHRPARTAVPAPNLHFGLQVEIDAIAAVKP